MLTADDLRIRADPGPEFAWHMRIWWMHANTPVTDDDLKQLRTIKGTIRDAVAISGS